MAKKNIVVNVDGKPKILRLGFNGLIELEEVMGKPITEMSDGSVSFKDFRAIFYVAFKHGGMKSVTIDKTGELLDSVIEEEGMEYLANKVGELFESVTGGQKDSFPTS